jgi:mannose-6-phosphate isomerase
MTMTNNDDFSPFRLEPSFAERIWGRTTLAPFYPSTGTQEKVGEAWLTGPQSKVVTGIFEGKTLAEVHSEFPLLVKMLFPDDKLSVQVHPDDEQARALGLARGKTECWYVLQSEPGAKVACGLKAGTSVEDVRLAIAEGTLEDLMEWLEVAPGEMVFVDAGTVHAIGPGMTLLEVQQTCDVTYRLYDYGRPRELHLEQGLAVVKPKTRAGKVEPRQMEQGFTRLIETEYFIVDRFVLEPGEAIEMPMDGIGCIAGLSGSGAVNEVRFDAGQAVVIADGSVTMTSQHGCTYVRCYEPAPAESN